MAATKILILGNVEFVRRDHEEDVHFQMPLGRVMPKPLLKFLGKTLPNLFAYQIVLKLQARTN